MTNVVWTRNVVWSVPAPRSPTFVFSLGITVYLCGPDQICSLSLSPKDTRWSWWSVGSVTPWPCRRRILRHRSRTWSPSTSLRRRVKEGTSLRCRWRCKLERCAVAMEGYSSVWGRTAGWSPGRHSPLSPVRTRKTPVSQLVLWFLKRPCRSDLVTPRGQKEHFRQRWSCMSLVPG